MLSALLVIAVVMSLVTTVWSLVIIFRRSVLGGVLSLLFGLPILYYLVTGWGKEGEDIKVPFFLNFACWLVVGAVAMTSAKNLVEEAVRRQASEPAAHRTPRFREPAPAAENMHVRDTSPSTQATQPAFAPRLPEQRTGGVKEAQRRPRAAHSDCVYKPVMTDEDIAKCR